MNVLFFILGIICGIAIAWILNKFLANKIGDKNHRIGLKAAAYIVCIVLSVVFFTISSLRISLNSFLERKMEFIELELVKLFPNSNLLETNIDTGEFISIVDELEQAVNTIKTNNDGYFERLVFGAFLDKLTDYVYAVKNGIATITSTENENGLVTIRSILYNLKNKALETISLYFVFGQTGILILLIIYILIYVGITAFLKKGGAMYNKSIVFGNADFEDSEIRAKNKE
jgi:hypothetical protein